MISPINVIGIGNHGRPGNRGNRARRIVIATLALLAAGCASMHGIAPEASLTHVDKLASERSLAPAKLSPSAWPDPAWWKSFGDPNLDRLIDDALATSPTLKVAAARTRRALAMAGVAKASLAPKLNASADATRERFSAHDLVPPPLGGTWNTQLDLQAALSWELDFWGRNRATYEAALGRATAAQVRT